MPWFHLLEIKYNNNQKPQTAKNKKYILQQGTSYSSIIVWEDLYKVTPMLQDNQGVVYHSQPRNKIPENVRF